MLSCQNKLQFINYSFQVGEKKKFTIMFFTFYTEIVVIKSYISFSNVYHHAKSQNSTLNCSSLTGILSSYCQDVTDSGDV